MTTTHEIIAAARSYLGVRFVHQGRSRAGLDCLGLLLLTAEKARLDFDGRSALQLDVPRYGTRPDTDFLHARLMGHLMPVEVPQLGDILVLMIDGRPQHLAIVTDYPEPGEQGMIHAHGLARQVVEHRYDAYWRAATVRVFRLPQLA